MKGQAAIEYLATYGWVLLVVSVVTVALWQSGIFKIRPQMGAFNFQVFHSVGYNIIVDSNGVNRLSAGFSNETGLTITDVNISISSTDYSDSFTFSGPFEPGDIVSISNAQVNPYCVKKGDIYELSVLINYSIQDQNTIYSDEGFIRGICI